MGYSWNDNTQLEIGVTQVPFGDLPYASHSYWFSTAYYLGFEDDYDMGLKLTHTWNNIDLAVAYFLQADPRGVGIDINAGRYSYDLVPFDPEDTTIVGASNVERNQFNGRAAYTFEMGEGDDIEVGISGQYGQIYNNQVTDEDDTWRSRYAAAVHVDADQGPFNLKLHGIYYKFNAVDNEGNTLDEVIMGAYGYIQPVVTNAALYTAGLAYELPFQLGPASFTVYNDYTYTDKLDEDLEDAHQNTFGVLIAAGPIYTYVDLASGYNHPWLTNQFGTGLGVESQDELQWNHRFNINLGYYF